MRALAAESQGIDRTLELSEQIINMGEESSNMLSGQASRLMNVGKNLGRLELSALPGADKLITLIGKE